MLPVPPPATAASALFRFRRLPRLLAEHLEGPEADEGLELAFHSVLTPLAQRWRFDGVWTGGEPGSGYDQAHVPNIDQLRLFPTGHRVG